MDQLTEIQPVEHHRSDISSVLSGLFEPLGAFPAPPSEVYRTLLRGPVGPLESFLLHRLTGLILDLFSSEYAECSKQGRKGGRLCGGPRKKVSWRARRMWRSDVVRGVGLTWTVVPRKCGTTGPDSGTGRKPGTTGRFRARGLPRASPAPGQLVHPVTERDNWSRFGDNWSSGRSLPPGQLAHSVWGRDNWPRFHVNRDPTGPAHPTDTPSPADRVNWSTPQTRSTGLSRSMGTTSPQSSRDNWPISIAIPSSPNRVNWSIGTGTTGPAPLD